MGFITDNTAAAPNRLLRFSLIELFYWGAYAGSAFIAAYLKDMGYAASLVGVIMSLISAVGIIAGPVMGSLADRIGSSRKVFLICIAIASALFIFVPMIKGTALLSVVFTTALLFIWAFFKNPGSGLLDSWAVDYINRHKDFQYGSVRLVGSFGYATMCIIYGQIAANTGSQVWSFRLYSILNIPLLLLCILKFKDEREYEKRFGLTQKNKVEEENKGENIISKTSDKKSGGVKLALSGYYFRMFLISHGGLGLAIYCLSTFIPYKMAEITGTTGSIGVVMACKAYMEMPMLLLGGFVVRRFKIRKLFPVCCSVFVLGELLCLVSQRVGVIIFALMFHGFAYGLYLFCIVNYIYSITPKEASASAISLAAAVQLGMSVAGNLIGGVLVDRFGAAGYYSLSLTVVTVSLIFFIITYPLGRKLGYPVPGEE